MLHFGPFFSQALEWIHSQANFVLCVQAIAAVLFTLLFISVYSEKVKSSERGFLLLGILALSLMRSFTFYADSYNPDEGMHLANAIALDACFRPWGATDFTTFGPVNAVLVLVLGKVLAFVGVKSAFTYFTLRLLNVLLLDASFVLFEKALAKHVQAPVSRAVSMLFVLFYGFHFQADVLAFNAEIVYIFFAAAALFLLSQMHGEIRKRVLFGFGVTCGTMPYVKLQAAPMCAVLACGAWVTVARSAREYDKNGKRALEKAAPVLAAGMVLPTALLALAVIPYKNGLGDAWFYFIENAKSHIGNPGIAKYFSQCIMLLEMFSPDALIIGIFVPSVLVAYIRSRKIKVTWEFLFSILFLLVSFFAVVRSFRLFYHYINFLVVPVLFFLAQSVQAVIKQEERFWEIPVKPAVMGLLALCSAWQFGKYYEEIKTGTVFSTRQVVGETNLSLTQAAAFLSGHTSAEDTIVVWGWEQRLYVYANRVPATRQTDIQRLFPPYGERNVQMYLLDIQKRRPAYIVDVVAPGSFVYEDGSKYALEQHPEVWNAVKGDYTLVLEMPVGEGSYKFYERDKD